MFILLKHVIPLIIIPGLYNSLIGAFHVVVLTLKLIKNVEMAWAKLFKPTHYK
jgi:hypothetical protein